MPILLHRFPLSHFSEKGRALLDFKGLPYEIREYTLGFPQRKLVALSGQRKVPVIEHEGRVVYDSTRIAFYLDDAFPDRPRLIPEEPALRKEVLDLEDRIDRVLGIGDPLIWGEYALTHRDHLDLLALEIHGATVRRVRALTVPVRLARKVGFGEGFVRKWTGRTRALLTDLAARTLKTPYLCGAVPTLADLAAVGLSLHLEFPRSKYFPVPEMMGRGLPEWTDDPAMRPFFEWRRRFYAKHLA